MIIIRPLLICALLGVVGLLSWSLLIQPTDTIASSGIKVEKVTGVAFRERVRATNVSFAGRDEANRPIAITASSAIPTDQSYSQVELEQTVASVDLGDGGALTVQSTSGTYNRDAETLQLQGGVKFASDDGFEMNTSEAAINIANKSIVSTQPVAGTDPRGKWQSEGMQLLEGGERVILTGKSSVTFLPSAFAGTTPATTTVPTLPPQPEGSSSDAASN